MAWSGMEWHGVAWSGMEWHGMAWHGIGLNYTYKEILNALKTKGRYKDALLLLAAHAVGQ